MKIPMRFFCTYFFEWCFLSGGEHHWLAGFPLVRWVPTYNISALYPNAYLSNIYILYMFSTP